MSNATADYATRLNLAGVVARIERAQAETRKFVAKHDKLAAEQQKLNAETSKLRRDCLRHNCISFGKRASQPKRQVVRAE